MISHSRDRPTTLYRLAKVLSRCVASIALLTLAGCGNEATSDAGAETLPAVNLTHSQRTATNSVATDRTLSAQSPAAPVSDYESVISTPERVCKQFMKRLQEGDRIGAENLLTRVALSVTARAKLRLEPMTGPDSTYQILPARYATTNHKLAQVDCRIADVIDGETIDSEITWLVRRQESGWRISGILLEFERGQPKDLLSFESIDDVATIKMLASSHADSQSGSGSSRQAAASQGNNQLQ